MNVVILDVGMGNLFSLTSALGFLGAAHLVTAEAEELSRASHVILPGVGAFDAAMERIETLGLDDVLRTTALETKVPFLGVCLGMQLMFDSSEEGERPGLRLVPGRLTKLTADISARLKVPHVGFDRTYGYRPEGMFAGQVESAHFYFTHSFALNSLEAGCNVAMCDHSSPFVAAFQHENICGAQFHPEKSQSTGLQLLADFLSI